MYKKTKTITNKPLNEKLILTLPVLVGMFRSIYQIIIYFDYYFENNDLLEAGTRSIRFKQELPRLREVYLFPTEKNRLRIKELPEYRNFNSLRVRYFMNSYSYFSIDKLKYFHLLGYQNNKEIQK